MRECESTRAVRDPSLTDAASALEDLVAATTDALAAADAPEPARERVASAGTELVETLTTHADRVSDLEARVDELAAQVDDLETALTTERETRAKDAAEDRKRLHDLETRVDEIDDNLPDTTSDTDRQTGSDPSTPGVQPPETPLEDVIRVPEHLVDESLTANQRRARFVAKDVHEYTHQVPAGRAIKSSELRRVLTAGEDTTMYTETVSRVIRFLDDLGDDAVKVVDSKRGERIVVFTEAFVQRVVAYRNHADHDSNSVVTSDGVAG